MYEARRGPERLVHRLGGIARAGRVTRSQCVDEVQDDSLRTVSFPPAGHVAGVRDLNERRSGREQRQQETLPFDVEVVEAATEKQRGHASGERLVLREWRIRPAWRRPGDTCVGRGQKLNWLAGHEVRPRGG